jgi:CRP/FNR family transcriptional regulator, cyclic AMP receptor protein
LDVRAIIDATAMVRDMPASDRAALARAARLRRYRAGEYVWRAGDPERGLFLIAQGVVHIGIIGPDGEEIIFHVVGPGESMGEPGIYAPEGDRQTDGRVMAATVLVTLPSDAVRAVLEASLEAMRLFVRRLSAMARSHSRRVALTAFHDARGRLARLLLDLLDSHGAAAPRGRHISLPLSQRALAGLCGLRRESVNRLIAAFERDGALRFEDGQITVLDARPLVAALGIDG